MDPFDEEWWDFGQPPRLPHLKPPGEVASSGDTDKEPIWKKPEGMTFEDVEELKPGEVGIVFELEQFRKISGRVLEIEHTRVVAERGSSVGSVDGLRPAPGIIAGLAEWWAAKKRTGHR